MTISKDYLNIGSGSQLPVKVLAEQFYNDVLAETQVYIAPYNDLLIKWFTNVMQLGAHQFATKIPYLIINSDIQQVKDYEARQFDQSKWAEAMIEMNRFKLISNEISKDILQKQSAQVAQASSRKLIEAAAQRSGKMKQAYIMKAINNTQFKLKTTIDESDIEYGYLMNGNGDFSSTSATLTVEGIKTLEMTCADIGMIRPLFILPRKSYTKFFTNDNYTSIDYNSDKPLIDSMAKYNFHKLFGATVFTPMTSSIPWGNLPDNVGYIVDADNIVLNFDGIQGETWHEPNNQTWRFLAEENFGSVNQAPYKTIKLLLAD